MRWLYLILFAFFCTYAYSQEKEITVSEKGVGSNVTKGDVVDPVRQRLATGGDTLRGKVIVPSLADSLPALPGLTPEKVFSQKQWKKYADSLRSLPLANIPGLPDIPRKEVSEQELVQAVNTKFMQSVGDSVPQHPPVEGLDSGSMKLPTAQALPVTTDQLQQLKLPQESLQSLMPTPASVIPTKYLDRLDSIRSKNLDREKLQLKEYKNQAGEQVSQFDHKPSLKDRTYFEGVIGFSPGDFTILQVAPALGFHVTDYLSFGAGPNLTVREEKKNVVATVGIKTLMKAEFWKRKVYLQVEDIMDTYGSAVAREERRTLFQQHNVYAGGGFLLSTKSPITLNFSMLYCITKNDVVSYDYSPMVFRIGLSSLKVKQ